MAPVLSCLGGAHIFQRVRQCSRHLGNTARIQTGSQARKQEKPASAAPEAVRESQAAKRPFPVSGCEALAFYSMGLRVDAMTFQIWASACWPCDVTSGKQPLGHQCR